MIHADSRVTSGTFERVLALIIECPEFRQAVKYISPSLVVTATRRHRPRRGARTTEILVTLGAPNVRARAFVRAARAAGEPFPIKKIQLRRWPARRGN